MGILNFFKKKVIQEPVVDTIVKQEPAKKDVLLKDFFNVDITSIRPQEGETRIALKKLELGMFLYIDFYFPSDGKVNIDLLSISPFLSDEVTELINLCAQKFGPTKAGETIITPRDELFLERGVFSRLWDKIWFDMYTNEDMGFRVLRLTIFDVEKTGLIKIK